MDEIINKFDSIVTALSPVSNYFASMNSALIAAEVAVADLFNEGSKRSVPRPDPQIGGDYSPTYVAVRS